MTEANVTAGNDTLGCHGVFFRCDGRCDAGCFIDVSVLSHVESEKLRSEIKNQELRVGDESPVKSRTGEFRRRFYALTR